MTIRHEISQRFLARSLPLFLLLLPLRASSQPEVKPPTKTQVVLLGTGHPVPDPDRSGPATAIIVNGTPYLIDIGAGVVRRAAAAVLFKGLKALAVVNIKTVFVTHLHPDHTVGYPDLIFSPAWSLNARGEALEVFGPPGLAAMTEHIVRAYQPIIELSTGTKLSDRVHAHEITPGTIHKDQNVTVKAFLVSHDGVPAFGYRFETPDRTIVISGDTSPTDSIVDNCHGCDVLIHEVYSEAGARTSPGFLKTAPTMHTSTTQLAELAHRAKPGLLVLYHLGTFQLPSTCDAVESEMRQVYRGKLACGRDLDVY